MFGLRKLIRSTAFRLAAFYLLIFGLSASGLLGLVYWRSAGFTAQQIDETISAEIQGLYERYRLLGIPGLTQVVEERSSQRSQSLYHLLGQSERRLAGNIDGWPTAVTNADGWIDFEYALEVGGVIVDRRARGREIDIQGGYRLLVGRDVQQRVELVALIESAFWWAGAGILALGLIGGLLISRQTLRRVDAMAAASAQIMAGDLAQRVPQNGSGDELDRLAVSLNAMLERIETLMTAVRQVSDNIAHDLRTPLNRLRARTEVTLMSDADAPTYRDALERTLEDADALLATFNALLDIARLEGAETGPNDTVDLADIVDDVADLYGPVAEDAEIVVDVSAPKGVVFVKGDRRLLAQALANLLDNAIKYTPPGGAVRIAATLKGSTAHLSVADNGPGVPDAERDRIFDRFVRLESDRAKPGNGLGLSLVRAVATMHSAKLTASNANPGLRIDIAMPALAFGA
ncbi:MAG: ATP-binding protein [Alphaproteobacteria bacterium]